MIAIRAAATQLNQSQVEELCCRHAADSTAELEMSEKGAQQKAKTENPREAGPRGHVVVWFREASASGPWSPWSYRRQLLSPWEPGSEVTMVISPIKNLQKVRATDQEVVEVRENQSAHRPREPFDLFV